MSRLSMRCPFSQSKAAKTESLGDEEFRSSLLSMERPSGSIVRKVGAKVHEK